MYGVLSRVKQLNGLLLTNKINDNLAKYPIRDDVLNEEKTVDEKHESLYFHKDLG